jgi:hypothetical protein
MKTNNPIEPKKSYNCQIEGNMGNFRDPLSYRETAPSTKRYESLIQSGPSAQKYN